MGVGNPRHRITPAAAAYALLLLVVAVFNPAFGNQFINFDDPGYITRNPMVQSGFTRDSLWWAFTSFDCANWHPLTWISHLLDIEIFGPLPLGPHVMNVVYHAAAAALLCVLLQRLTGALWPAFLTAALFAVHPLRVESVAWAAERKDVLSACFWMLTLLAYTWYVRRPGARRLLVVVVVFALGLMAKPMLVTLPAILLVLDWWPLGRVGAAGPRPARLGGLVLEKLPLLLLAALSAVVTFKAQVFGGAVVPLVSLSVGKRLANAAVGVLVYLSKIFWPTDLSMFYARPSGGVGLLAGAGAVLLLALVTLGAVLAARRRPYLLAGWAWYLTALVPVLGIVQVGYQPWADRYTYIPSVGIAVAAVWVLADGARGRRRVGVFLVAAAAGAVLVLSVATQQYLSVWGSGERLFKRALAAGGDTYMMRFCLAGELLQAGRVEEAGAQFTQGLALNPLYPDGHLGMAIALDMQGNLEKAAVHYRRALELNPRKVETHAFFASLLERTGSAAGAEEHFREALRLDPDDTVAREGVCRLLEGAGVIFAPPLFPACGDPETWWSLDKPLYLTYVESAKWKPSWAIAE